MPASRNKVTHAKPLPSVERSKRFLCGYLHTLRNLKTVSTTDMIKGKQAILTDVSDSVPDRLKEPPDMCWNIHTALLLVFGMVMILNLLFGELLFRNCMTGGWT
jgi:hypothetical protein